ncbi:xanthine dehydrogenase family protein molybdopterin-binding subunit [Paraflavitalea pollutisoli]|uniref:xanthine dehydrogenase family protein molybdopterin-binding subunit n=1 Tax=Paraflavitalea pollutisoli TaxID=3034143 RepID=UPI0023EB997F|nr:molybdopterin cofactor-binding domain-containing protein [Paraflavitalea sp. H1-2-19X]
MESTQHTTSRRDFLKWSSFTAGGLVLGFKWVSAEAQTADIFVPAADAAQVAINHYLSIGTDGIVTIFSPNPELGQNIMTSFPMIVAEELDADWNKVKVVQAPLDKRFDRQLTGGSGAVPHSWMLLRKAGATARYMLIAAAAKQWGVPESECTASEGFVLHKGSDKKLSYGELATAAGAIAVPANVTLKDKKDFKLIGTAVKNVANHDILTGKPLYGLDFYREGMLYATIQRPPSFGTKVKSFDAAAAKQVPGIIDVVQVKNGVAVVGTSTWQVMKAKKALKITYENSGNIESTSDHDRIFGELLNSDKATVRRKDGDVDAAFKSAAKVIRKEFQCPFLSHSPMEPMNFFAHVKEDSVELIGPCQIPGSARTAVSKLLNIPEEKITLDLTRLGGGFGRRLYNDYVVEAAEVSSLIKAPVKVIWSREDDMTGGTYRPAVRYRFEAALDASGNMIGYKLRGAGINSGNPTRESNFPTGAIENLLIDSIEHQSPITTGAWRAPITNFLAYAEQAFLDEVAEAAGKDPIDFRLELFEKVKAKTIGKINYNVNRMIDVTKRVRERSNWGKAKKGVYQGFSVYFSHASYVAQVAEVVLEKGKPVVKKVFAVSDCGQVVNLGGARQQVMGAIVDGMGHAYFGKLSFKDGAAEQSNFHNYRLIRMKEIPEVDLFFVDSGFDPTGLGEPALPPTGGAVANAIFKATGKRMYKQPFTETEAFTTTPGASGKKTF